MVAVYPLGVPSMYFILLWRKRDKLDPGQEVFETTMSEEEALEKALIDRRKNEEEDPTLKSLAFLYAAYEPKRYYFECFETLRKLALTGFLVFLVPGTASQIVISMIMCMFSMRVYSGCKPFIRNSHDRFSEVAQWQLFFTMLGALAMKVNLEGENWQSKKMFDLTLTLLQVVPAAITLLYNAYEGKKTAERAVAVRNNARKKKAFYDVVHTDKSLEKEERNFGRQCLDEFNSANSKALIERNLQSESIL